MCDIFLSCSDYVIDVEKATFSWTPDDPSPTLNKQVVLITFFLYLDLNDYAIPFLLNYTVK